MNTPDFVHLHTHSHFSLNEGVPSVLELVSHAARLGFTSLALTDTNTLAGIAPFVKACRDFGLKPIIGCEINILPFRTRMKGLTHERGSEIYRATLLVQNEQGFRNLVKLANRAHRNLQEGNPAITFSGLQESSQGLFFLTGSHKGELYHLLKKARIEETEEYLRQLIHIFGKSHVFFELIRVDEERERTFNSRMVQLAHFLDIGIVCTNDVHYILPEDEAAYLCMREAETLLEAGAGCPFGEILTPEEFTRHLAPAEFMGEKFRAYPEALEKTCELARRCTFALDQIKATPWARLPLYDFVRGQDADSFLWDTIFEKASQQYGALSPKIKKRLNEEFECINSRGLSNYLVFLHRVADYLNSNGIPFIFKHKVFSTSLIAFLLGMAEGDPLKHRIRFIPAEGEESIRETAVFEMPSQFLEKVMEYILEMFPPGSVCEMGTSQTWSRPGLLDHIAKWARLSPEDASFLFQNASENTDILLKLGGKMLPNPPDSLQENPYIGYQNFMQKHRDQLPVCSTEFLLAIFSRLYPRPKTLQPKKGSLAFCGKDMEALVPCEQNQGRLISQFDEKLVDDLGINRIRILPNSMLDILSKSMEWIRSQSDPRFSAEAIDFSDAKTFELLGMGLTDGIFPFDSITTKTILRNSRPKAFMEIVKIITDLSAYSFPPETASSGSSMNISLSIAMCRVAFRLAYIKAHFPASFMTAVLSHAAKGGRFPRLKLSKKRPARLEEPGSDDSRSCFPSLLRHAKRMGVEIKPPSINESIYPFSQEGEAIRTGLVVIRNMGERAAKELITIRQGGPYHDLADLCHRTNPRLLNHRLLVNLIKAGTLDSFGMKRSQLLHVLEQTIGYARDQEGSDSQIPEMFDPLEMDLFSQVPDIPEFTAENLMRMEREATGYAVTRYPLEMYAPLLEAMGATPLKELSLKHLGTERYLGGFIDHIDRHGPLIDEHTKMVLDFEGILVKAPPEVARKYNAAILVDLPLFIGGKVERNGDFPALTAHCCYLLEDLFTQLSSVQKICLDCALPPVPEKESLKKIHKIFKQYPGHIKPEVINVPEGCGRIAQKINKLEILFCPPVYFEMKNLFSSESFFLYTGGNTPDEQILKKW